MNDPAVGFMHAMYLWGEGQDARSATGRLRSRMGSEARGGMECLLDSQKQLPPHCSLSARDVLLCQLLAVEPVPVAQVLAHQRDGL